MIKRYEIQADGWEGIDHWICEDGKWVKWEDVKNLESTLAAVRAIVADLATDLNNLRASRASGASGGVHVPYHGYFACSSPSVLKDLERLSRRLHEALSAYPAPQHPDSALLDRIAEKLEVAVAAANGRWSEWGDRALDVAEHLDEAQEWLRARASTGVPKETQESSSQTKGGVR